MKSLRLLLVGALLFLVTVATPAKAQAAGEFVGYLRLLSQVDANLPIYFQSQKALSRIMPRLLALQKDGTILEFEPELSRGVLKVKYSAASALSALGGIQAYTSISDAMANVPQSERLTISAAGPNFIVELYGSCFTANNLAIGSHVVGSLRDKTGRVVANYEDDADGSGYIDGCFSWNGSFSDIVPGYKLTFKAYDATPTLLGTYIVFAPVINFTTINNANAVVGGRAPAKKPYTVFWSHPDLNAGNTTTNLSLSGKTTSAGQWAKDFGAVKFRGGDHFTMLLHQNPQFAFFRDQNAPAMYCQLGSNYCDLAGFAFQPAKLSIIHNGIPFTFSGTFSSCGCFSQVLESNGNPIFLKAGDQISGTSVGAYRLPTLTAAINFTSDVVSGKAPAQKYFELWVNTSYLDLWYPIRAHANSSGNYSGDFTSQVDLGPKQATNVEVFYQDGVTGNITDYYLSVGP